MSALIPNVAPGPEDFRALAQSSPWRFTTVHFTHSGHRNDVSEVPAVTVEAWLDRPAQRVTVRSSHGVEIAEGVPYSVSGAQAGASSGGAPLPNLRPDGLVAERPDGWHFEYGDPMWRDYQWTAMLDPAELSHGVQIDDVSSSTLRGRPVWSATCRPLTGAGEDWEGGYDPRCGCCPLLDSAASRIIEYGSDQACVRADDLPRPARRPNGHRRPDRRDGRVGRRRPAQRDS